MSGVITKLTASLFLWCIFVSGLVAQNCTTTVRGLIMDEHQTETLAFATIYVLDAQRGVQADALGNFQIDSLCNGPVRVRFTHIGCDPKTLTLQLQGDTTLNVYLHHHDNYTETVTVTANSTNVDYGESLDAEADQQIGEVLERINGVSTLRTGTAAAKPVYDGLYGNRLSLQNNGIAQSGQQWGNDHAPEIDPWVAAYMRVVEGADALRYGGSTVGATVLVEPAPLTPRTRPGGRAAYSFRSNGLGHTLNARLTDSAFVSYRLSGTLKLAGDQRAPDYFLNNTGRREANAALQLARFINPRLTTRLYYSLFSSEIGVLRGSHIGNLSDLQEAIGRDRPFFTDERFSYDIGSPRQSVSHHLLKAEINYQANSSTRYTLRYGGQVDNRKEFDVRRGDDDRPALELLQYDHFLEGTYSHQFDESHHLEAGIQGSAVANDNQPGTGVLPLIPDYNARRASSYFTYHGESSALRYQFGLRYDHQSYEAIIITREPPVRVVRIPHHYNTLGGAAGARWVLNERLTSTADLTYRERAPQINELYSQGLHQGVSGIEEGDPDLRPERSTKANLGMQYSSGSGRLTLTAGAFVQRITDFINLEPEQEFRLTIRGAFPLFRYRGVDASLIGGKLTALANLGKLDIDSRLAFIRGQNLTENRPLVYVPSTNWRTTLSYSPAGSIRLMATSQVVFRQERLEPDQDFLPPPPGYAIFDLSASRTFDWGDRSLLLSLEAENLTDLRYRDYLDRQRYYADAPGRSINFRLAFSW